MPVYLKYGDKIKGNVKDPAHRGWIELSSVQFGAGVSTPTGQSTGRSGSPTLNEIYVTKKNDSTSVHLFRESLSGEAVVATIEFARADGSVYLRLELKGTLISSYHVSGTGADALDSFTLNFTEMKFQNIPGTPPTDEY